MLFPVYIRHEAWNSKIQYLYCWYFPCCWLHIPFYFCLQNLEYLPSSCHTNISSNYLPQFDFTAYRWGKYSNRIFNFIFEQWGVGKKWGSGEKFFLNNVSMCLKSIFKVFYNQWVRVKAFLHSIKKAIFRWHKKIRCFWVLVFFVLSVSIYVRLLFLMVALRGWWDL